MMRADGVRMSRWRAVCYHVLASLLVAVCAAAVIYFFWFPQPYFVAAGAVGLMIVLMGVDAALGPLLTLIVFAPKKKPSALRFDLFVIAALQLAAFAYGAWVIYQARPVFIVGEVDRLVLVTAEEISQEDLTLATLPEARNISWKGPQLVGATPPVGPDTFDLIASAMKGGKDIRNMPQYYHPYSDAAPSLISRARPLLALKGVSNRQKRKLEKLQATADSQGYGVMFLPVERGKHFFTAIIRDDNALPIALLALDPWESGSIGE